MRNLHVTSVEEGKKKNGVGPEEKNAMSSGQQSGDGRKNKL